MGLTTFAFKEITLQPLPVRPMDANKSDFGHVLVIGGAPGMMGAARLAGEAALRVGAGLVSIATSPELAAYLGMGRPELMVHGVSHFAYDVLDHLLQKATVIAIGPGLGQLAWSEWLLDQVLLQHKPLILDADALNLLSKQTVEERENWILTPHPGEAARLLGLPAVAIQKDRASAVTAIQKKYGGVTVLKGAGTLIAYQDGIAKCAYGNPGMASGGMGDTLTGIIAGLVAQKIPLNFAAEQGVLLHAMAGDIAAEAGQRGLLASDLLPYLRQLVNQ